MIDPGLCLSCQHALIRPTKKGTTYLRCGLAATDDRFPKYPRLPVTFCRGLAPQSPHDGWRPVADAAANILWTGVADNLVGVYLHGSAAFGDWVEASDVDLIAVVDGESHDWAVIGRHLAAIDGAALELSVVDASLAARPSAPWPFLLHVAGQRVVLGGDREGDPDLLLHLAVLRARGQVVTGPPIESVFGTVPAHDVRAALSDEIRWGLAHADATYAVLNACRAHAFAATGRFLSKLEGARWGELNLPAYGDLIRRAVAAQLVGADFAPEQRAVIGLVGHVLQILGNRQ